MNARTVRARRQEALRFAILWRREGEMRMTCLYMVIALFIVAAIISFVLSLLGVLFVGALRLIPIVMLVLAVAVLLGKVKISIVHDDDDDRR